MRNLIERLRKQENVRDMFRSDKIKYERKKSIRDVLRPIYILGIIFGLRVFEFPRSRSRPILSFLYSMSLFSLYHVGWIYQKERIYGTGIFNLSSTVTYIISITQQVSVFIILIMGLYQSKSSKLFVTKINEIDKTLQVLGSSASFNSIYKKTIMNIIITIFYLFFLFTIIIVQIILLKKIIYESFIIYFSLMIYIYIFMIEFIFIIEFFTIIRCIKSEFRRANELLSDINVLPISSIALELLEHKEADGSLSIERSLPVDSKKIFIARPSNTSRLQVASHKINRSRRLLRTIRQVHLELYRISKSYSNMYGIQISLEMAISVLSNIYLLYNLYITFEEKTENNSNLIFDFIIFILCCLQYILKIFVINYICDKTTKEAERTSEIIHTFYGQNTDFEIKKEVEIFSLQMMQCRTAYTAFGLYNFNCKHICSCIGIITTYMVIMIQKIQNSFKMFRSKELQQSVRPLIIANSIVCTGLLEYFIERPIRTIGFVYIICFLISYTTLIFGFMNKINIFIEVQTTKIAEIISKLYYFLNAFLYIITIFAGFARRKKVKLFMEQLIICTRGFDELNISTNYYSLFRYQCIIGTILIFIILGIIVANVVWLSKINCDNVLKLLLHFCEDYPLIVTIINDFTFVFWIRQVNHFIYNTTSQNLLNNNMWSQIDI
ncbi:putative gustatory receptor 28b [Vespula maculifrons]|uniref:Gustatory receptor n=1 Tax=Vespula maculifrons TaxID=7453 RepID=A0ABD2CRI9_VESMC